MNNFDEHSKSYKSHECSQSFNAFSKKVQIITNDLGCNLHIDTEDNLVTIKIKFCPYCGEKLDSMWLENK